MRRSLVNMTKVTASNHYEVLVIGAGISGLACASKLYKHDYFKKPGKLLVLEGRDRVGGRIESVNVNGVRLDTGANWIHGVGTAEDPNPLLELVPKKRYRALSGSVLFKAPEKETRSELTGVSSIIPKEVSGALFSGLWETIEALHERATAVTAEEAKDTTIYKAIVEAESFKQSYQDLPEEYHHTFGSMFKFVENMEAGPLIHQSLERPEGKSTMSLLEYAIKDFTGEQVFVQDGYTSIIEALADDLMQSGLINLNTEITSIDWTRTPIRIQAGHATYTADQVVCTLPLGVLKDEASRIFKPTLPSEKEEAIQKLGFGTLNKIFLVFDRPWWSEEPYISMMQKGMVKLLSDLDTGLETPDLLVGFTTELRGFQIHKDGTVSNAPCDISVVNLHNLTGFPALSCFVSCSTAVEIEKMTNDQAGDIIHKALSNWFGQEIPKTIAVHVTRWSTDRFSKGSYSHMIAGLSEASHRVEFQKPVTNEHGGVLRFAGEHTSRNHFAVVQGALLSGRREADAILKQIGVGSLA